MLVPPFATTLPHPSDTRTASIFDPRFASSCVVFLAHALSFLPPRLSFFGPPWPSFQLPTFPHRTRTYVSCLSSGSPFQLNARLARSKSRTLSPPFYLFLGPFRSMFQMGRSGLLPSPLVLPPEKPLYPFTPSLTASPTPPPWFPQLRHADGPQTKVYAGPLLPANW